MRGTTASSNASPLRLFLVLLLVIFTAEAGAMFLFGAVLPPDTPLWVESTLDATLLTVVCTPFLWLFAFRSLQESERNNRGLLNAITETAFLVDTAGTILAVNTTTAQRHGAQPEAMLKRSLFEFLPEERIHDQRRRLREVIDTRAPLRFEERRDRRHYEISLYPVCDSAGHVARIAVYQTDVTERNRLQGIDGLLAEIDRHALRSTDIDGLLQFIAEAIVALFDFRIAWVGRKEKDGSVAIQACAGSALEYREELGRLGVRWDGIPQDYGPVGLAIRTGDIQNVTLSDADVQPWQRAARRFDLRAILAIPLSIRGTIHGALAVYGDDPALFADPSTVAMLSGLATRICIAVRTAQDQQELRLLEAAVTSAGSGIFIADRTGHIRWTNPAFAQLSGYDAEEILGRNPRFLKADGHDQAYYQDLWQTILAGKVWKSETLERRKDGSLYTVLQTITPIRDRRGAISHFISIHEDITLQKLAEARVQRLAHYDTLTDLPNRALFFDRLRQAIAVCRRQGHALALMFLDLDHFKAVNDTLGHHIGDLLLQAVAQRLRGCVRETDTVARLAGDEFTIILPEVATREAAAVIAEKVIIAIATPFTIKGHDIRVGTSIGISLFPVDGDSDEVLLNVADAAMYDAKKQSRNTYRFRSGELPVSIAAPSSAPEGVMA